MSPKLILFAQLLCSVFSYSQPANDYTSDKLDPGRWSTVIEQKLDKLQTRIIVQTERILGKLQKQEEKLARRLFRVDSATCRNLLTESQKKYQGFKNQKVNKVTALEGFTGEYVPYFDSLKGCLSFLGGRKDLLSELESSQMKDALRGLQDFQNELQKAEAVKLFVKERRQQLNEVFSHYTDLPGHISKLLRNYSKEIYYYSEQLRELREMFRDPDKFLSRALTILNKLPAFQQFMREHSELRGLFSLSPGYGSPVAIEGLQTRDQVRQVLSNQIGSSNVGQVFSQQIEAAQLQLDQFKQKVNRLGGSSGDIDMPDFKPNTQHRKTFFERLEYGANIQTTKANSIFPSTTDLAFTVGYRIDDKKIAGIGIAGKIGWGSDIQHVSVTGQGMSIRSFFDIKIKNSFYASGGFEYNYQQPFSEIQQLHDLDLWSRSGLVGITKIISIKSKVFKKTKVQLLWDFLCYHQLPRREPVKFRMGYNF